MTTTTTKTTVNKNAIVKDVYVVTNPDLILDPTKPAYIICTFRAEEKK
jgi:hypothetical protein